MKPVTFFFLTGVVEYLDIEMIIAIFVMQGKKLGYVIIYNVKLGAYLLLAIFGRR